MPESGRTPAVEYGAELALAFDAFHEAVMRVKTLDVATTELVRMRCAQYHDCRNCRSLRLKGANDAGVDERIIEQLGEFDRSDLSEPHKVALRIATSHLTSPSDISESLGAAAATHFTQQQVVEILLDVCKWSYQKAFVALGLDSPTTEGRLRSLEFDSDGKAIIG